MAAWPLVGDPQLSPVEWLSVHARAPSGAKQSHIRPATVNP